ncbi:HDOD domain-containing protein [Massilia yuzhufengensis]|uniref:HD-like signal output (HDOD) domain, no enzymatic activity n=1 Tax=Massilia yuzhufengensis TaxID=1164594 RepID=A0A1I1U8L5_9BURK|nr:HDOD domain-containing protein [Massilia yuzhufengensis]SFD67172.1 HD-like signal output (HDOD) domain, no enzymatic activity [Massilia yuzhufengensis]
MLDLDLAFFRWLGGAAAHVGSAPEQLILDELARLARQPEAAADLVPRVPAVIPQLLRSLRDDGIPAAELARQVAQDVTLVAEVIREVNSPYYGATAKVGTIEGALMLLGQNGLRMLLARVAFRPVISAQGGRLARQAAPQVWSQSEKCAAAASMAAPALGADPFEAYLAGLMQNVGLIVAFRLADQVAGAAALPQSDAFAHALMDSARTLSARIAALWELPQPVSGAILQAGMAGAAPLAQALREGDRLSKLRLLLDAGIEGASGLAAALPATQARIFDQLAARDD